MIYRMLLFYEQMSHSSYLFIDLHFDKYGFCSSKEIFFVGVGNFTQCSENRFKMDTWLFYALSLLVCIFASVVMIYNFSLIIHSSF